MFVQISMKVFSSLLKIQQNWMDNFFLRHILAQSTWHWKRISNIHNSVLDSSMPWCFKNILGVYFWERASNLDLMMHSDTCDYTYFNISLSPSMLWSSHSAPRHWLQDIHVHKASSRNHSFFFLKKTIFSCRRGRMENRLKSKHEIFQQCHGQEPQKNKLFQYRPILIPVESSYGKA